MSWNLLDGSEPFAHARPYMLTLAASGDLEVAYFNSARALLSSEDEWELISETHRTIEFNHLCFKTLSRGACLIEVNLGLPHRQMPYKLFNILNDPEEATQVKDMPECCLDPIAKLLEG